jgi:hypothetical protein
MSVEVLPSKYPLRSEQASKSKSQYLLGRVIQQVYSEQAVILEEFPVIGTRLSLDFFLPNHKIAFEFQGKQHTEFSPHFHRTRAAFERQQQRDLDKKSWCVLNGIRLIEVFETVDADGLRDLICQSQ